MESVREHGEMTCRMFWALPRGVPHRRERYVPFAHVFSPHLTGSRRRAEIAALVHGEREGRNSDMRAMLCGCGRHLEAASDNGLVREALAHRRQEHPLAVTDEELVRRVVADNAYGMEYVAVYAGGEGPDEEFGPEPY